MSLGFDCRIDTRRITVHGTGELRVITTSNMVDHNRLDQSLPYSRSRLPNRSLAADEVYTVLDRPTSSYIPTLKALEHTHQRMDALQSEVDANTTTYPSALLVSRHKRPGMANSDSHKHPKKSMLSRESSNTNTTSPTSKTRGRKTSYRTFKPPPSRTSPATAFATLPTRFDLPFTSKNGARKPCAYPYF